MKRQERKRGLVFGLKCLESLARYDQDLHLLRMSQCSLFGVEQESLQTLPKSGMMQNGLLSEQTMLEHGTKETESGSWPTPTTKGYGHASEGQTLIIRKKVEQGIITELEGEQMLNGTTLRPPRMKKWNFPTPTTQETEHPLAELTKTGRRKTKNGKTSHSLNLADTVKLFPTPMANEVRLGYQKRDTGKKGTQKSLTTIVIDKEGGQEKAIGQLNSEWVEWLMGYPIGWTDIGSENQRESQELGQDKQTECKDSKDSETL